MLRTCVSMATIIGDNDPINISLTLVALLATLTVAIAFTKESDNKAIVRRIAKTFLSLSTGLSPASVVQQSGAFSTVIKYWELFSIL